MSPGLFFIPIPQATYSLKQLFNTLLVPKKISISKVILLQILLAETSGIIAQFWQRLPVMRRRSRLSLLDALQELKASPEVISVVDTYKTLEEITTRARQVVEQIKLLGLIPGQCEICRRLGM